MMPEFREKKIREHEKSPGRPGEAPRLNFLISVDTTRPSGADGFVLWREEWGRRNTYDVELLCLSYAGSADNLSLPQKLLKEMCTKLDQMRECQIRTDLSEKANKAEYAAWKELGFVGFPGAKSVNRAFPGPP